MFNLSNKTRAMIWRTRDGRRFIFANSDTWRGKVAVWLKGYRKHETLFGSVRSKPLP